MHSPKLHNIAQYARKSAHTDLWAFSHALTSCVCVNITQIVMQHQLSSVIQVKKACYAVDSWTRSVSTHTHTFVRKSQCIYYLVGIRLGQSTHQTPPHNTKVLRRCHQYVWSDKRWHPNMHTFKIVHVARGCKRIISTIPQNKRAIAKRSPGAQKRVSAVSANDLSLVNCTERDTMAAKPPTPRHRQQKRPKRAGPEEGAILFGPNGIYDDIIGSMSGK